MEQVYHSALVAYIDRNEGLLWQAILKLQGIDAVFKPSLDNVYDYLKVNTPNILLMNINANSNNVLISGTVCRWCQSNLRGIKIFLINPYKLEISDLERRWAIRRGAIDMLPQLTRQNAMQSIKEVLNSVEKSPYHDVIPTLMDLIEKYNPTPSLSVEESITEENIDESNAQEIADSNPSTNNEEYITYRGIKVPRFSIASSKHHKLIYRGLPVKPIEDK